MRYQLAVLSHGDRADRDAHGAMLRFATSVTPAPDRLVVFLDGGPSVCTIPDVPGWPRPEVFLSSPAEGFCSASNGLWGLCRGYDGDFTFWLENDFEFERPVDLELLARSLEAHPDTAQMSLLRHPEDHELPSLVGSDWIRHYDRAETWLDQTVYWTTNPSLIPQAVIERVAAWPEGPHCEGKLTEVLLEQGYRFGVWGHGDPWVKHIGTRTGFGY